MRTDEQSHQQTNEPINQQTRPIAIPPGGVNVTSICQYHLLRLSYEARNAYPMLSLDEFSALMTSSERGGDVEAARDQIERMLGRTRDAEPSRDSIDVDIQLNDVIVVDVVNRQCVSYRERPVVPIHRHRFSVRRYRRRRRRGPPKIREKYFSGNYYVKFGHFRAKIV